MQNSKERYTPEFKAEVLKLVLEQGHGIAATSQRMGMSKTTLNSWVSRACSGFTSSTQSTKAVTPDLESENKRLRQALARAEMECEILKKSH